MGISPHKNTSNDEVADIFRLYADNYLSNNKVNKRQYAVVRAIRNCRTSALGYHLDQCDNCHHIEHEFNSCRDRHCPKCQAISRKKWVDARLKDILPVPYYHVVFTLPHFLNNIISYNKALIYELLLSKASETLLVFGRDPKWLGGEIGFYGVLHTWGQTLWPHVHVHFVVAAGALSDEGKWIEAKFNKSKFLLPVHALSKVFKGKFIEGLKSAYYQRQLTFGQQEKNLANPYNFEHWIDHLAGRKWVVYCKQPFDGAQAVVRYVGRYTHRVAISNNRIITIKDDNVCFFYKDYKASRLSWQKMTLSAEEFIRRFIWHVLPKGFHKIRHYGFLSNGRCKAMVELIRSQLNEKPQRVDDNDYIIRCPVCKKGILNPLITVNRIYKIAFAPYFKNKFNMLYNTS